MFGKPASSAAEPPRKPVAASLVTAEVAISGDLVSAGELHLDGAVTGDLRVGRLTLGEAGSVEGSIEADAVEIRGRVRGAIAARLVRLHASADVEGDITHAELAIDAGARFTGRSLRLDPAPALAALPAAAE